MARLVMTMALMTVPLIGCGDEGPASQAVENIEVFCDDFCGEGNPACLQSCVDTCYQRVWEANREDCTEVPPFTR